MVLIGGNGKNKKKTEFKLADFQKKHTVGITMDIKLVQNCPKCLIFHFSTHQQLRICIKIDPEQEKILSDHPAAHPANFSVPGVPA